MFDYNDIRKVWSYTHIELRKRLFSDICAAIQVRVDYSPVLCCIQTTETGFAGHPFVPERPAFPTKRRGRRFPIHGEDRWSDINGPVLVFDDKANASDRASEKKRSWRIIASSFVFLIILSQTNRCTAVSAQAYPVSAQYKQKDTDWAAVDFPLCQCCMAVHCEKCLFHEASGVLTSACCAANPTAGLRILSFVLGVRARHEKQKKRMQSQAILSRIMRIRTALLWLQFFFMFLFFSIIFKYFLNSIFSIY